MSSDQEKENVTLPSLEESNDITEITRQLHSLLNQIFSKEYLDTDPFLQSQVGLPLSLPTAAIYQSPRVLSITTDTELIRQAIETSHSLIVTENIVRPNAKAEQHTIILRDVDELVSEDTIKDVFVNNSCPSIVACRSEMNNTWFVTFSSEADARLALDKIKTVLLGGKPIRARLKTESLGRTFPRSNSGSDNSSPTYRPPQLVIDDHSNPSNTTTNSQQSIPTQSPQYYYPSMIPMSPHLMNPAGQSPGSGSTTPQYPVYYMYPSFPNGFIPHPMHHPAGPMGSPMYMGGVWMPPYPMMQMSPNANIAGTPGQQSANRGKHKQKSPRSGQPYSPSRNSQNKSFNPKEKQQGANPTESSTSPRGQSEKVEGSQEESKEQLENNGNKKKTFKKRKDRFQEGVAEVPKLNGTETPGNKDDQKTKDKSSYQSQYSKQENSNGDNSNGVRGKGGRDKSKQGKQPQVKPPPAKPENKFNLEADFPTLRNAPVAATHATQQPSGISWAARISKSFTQPEVASPSIPEKFVPPKTEHLDDQIKFTSSQPQEEFNISFGNIQINSSHPSDLIFQNNISQPTSVENKSQSSNQNSGKLEEKHVIMANIQESEYVPISFGAFEATIPEKCREFVDFETNHDLSGGMAILDIVRKGKV